MLTDRPYMRDRYETRRTGVLTWLISAIVATFILQNVLNLVVSHWVPAAGALEQWFGLHRPGIEAGHVWTLVTYGLLHSTHNILDIIVTLLGVFFIGREIIALLGSRRFLLFYAASLAAGGALWLAVHWHDGDLLLGSSAAVTSLFVLYAFFYPDREFTLLVFFLLPVTLKPKYAAIGMVTIDLIGFVGYEVQGVPSPLGMAHSAHLGGAAAAWIYFRFVHDARWVRPSIEMPAWMKRRKAAARPAPVCRVNVGPRVDLRAEVDRILDKINSQGFGSLSPEEKRVLDDARDLMTRR